MEFRSGLALYHKSTQTQVNHIILFPNLRFWPHFHYRCSKKQTIVKIGVYKKGILNLHLHITKRNVSYGTGFRF
jgi:hypothetical protein